LAHKGSHIHDDLLGYVPRAGVTGPGITIDGEGLRGNGSVPVAQDAPPIVAVGDSFTWGQDVPDAETWPARVQALTGRRVLNGGVSGYGFDQVVLRAEQLAERYRPSEIVVGFIADDVQRTEMSRLWGHNKPWFAPEGDGLVLRGVPVRPWKPLGLPPETLEGLYFRLPYGLQVAVGYHRRIHRAGIGLRIAERLVDRLAALQAASGCRVTLLAQYELFPWSPRFARAWVNLRLGLTRTVTDRARERGLRVVDCHGAIDARPKPADLFANFHMTGEGNRLVAGLVAAALSP
jgi:hypothetical protein